MKTIFVSRRGNSDQIKLRDSDGNDPGNENLTTSVAPGDKVKWAIDPQHGNLHSLQGIEKKDGTPFDLLAKDPSRQSDGSYLGNVKSDNSLQGKEEAYLVRYKLTEEGPTMASDPKLKMT